MHYNLRAIQRVLFVSPDVTASADREYGTLLTTARNQSSDPGWAATRGSVCPTASCIATMTLPEWTRNNPGELPGLNRSVALPRNQCRQRAGRNPSTSSETATNDEDAKCMSNHSGIRLGWEKVI